MIFVMYVWKIGNNLVMKMLGVFVSLGINWNLFSIVSIEDFLIVEYVFD